MKAIIASAPGGPDVLTTTTLPTPRPGPGEVAIDVVATAVNRADTLQRMGYYPPPPGTSDIIGLECSGRVAELGEGVAHLAVGDEVCALLAGGGYASRVIAPAAQVMPVPNGVDLVTAACLPEACATVWSNVFMDAALAPGETILVHGGAGGIGTYAIQMAAAFGAQVFTTAGTDEKTARCRELGASAVINYREQDFVHEVLQATDGRGVDVILDNMGASYLDRNLDALATGGRLAIIAMQGGTRGELRINKLLTKRATVMASSLRPRPVPEKGEICRQLVEEVWPMLAKGQVKPVVHATMPLEEAAAAHRMLEASEHLGKIVLTVDP
ncbi:NAD(P)H-quinone oxidoreductase [Nocardioides sp. AE5]|uniref:NAD(P)H-quinone oxidoreductase n=1 Tax=Nocardioides sp. AE5 TaxID=2962573 RepID=UPI002881361D|nr:NAD(P)H-quinone oxidoreductase [Nocardioides sp. AE5]MDT0202681.1 NAD(P)H-quinone oxidoreductase [Nocardioides sp. AE5]